MNFVHLFMRNMTGKQYCQTTNFALFNTFFIFLNSFFYFIHLLFVSLRTLLGRLWIAKKNKVIFVAECVGVGNSSLPRSCGKSGFKMLR